MLVSVFVCPTECLLYVLVMGVMVVVWGGGGLGLFLQDDILFWHRYVAVIFFL